MRITLSGINTAIPDNTRAYAEYRLFTSAARHEELVRSVDVVVRRDSRATRQFLCAVSVDLGPSGRIKTQARAAYPIAAIDRAAERMAWLLDRRRNAPDYTLKSSPFIS